MERAFFAKVMEATERELPTSKQRYGAQG